MDFKNLNKKSKSVITVYGIIAAVYILLYAVIPFSKPAGSWTMFVFSLISVAAGCYITLYAFNKGESLMSKYYGYPVFRIGGLYMALQLGLSIIIYIIGAFVKVPFWVGLLFSLLLGGAAAIGVIAADNARDIVEEIDDNTEEIIRNVRYFNIDIMDILDMCENEALIPSLKELADKFKYSDPVSVPETMEKEEQLKAELAQLRQMIADAPEEEVAKKIKLISNLLSSRNRIKGSM